MNFPQTIPKTRLSGLDTLRLCALVLITWQHAASVLGGYDDTQWHGISPGQIGVGMFCAISGYLAFKGEQADVSSWFRRRLLSIFPAYWLVTVAAFAMVMATGSKSVTIGLFVSQMLGLGYFTHGWSLVNVVSWFVSLILLCYALSFLAKKSRYPTIFWVVATTIVAVLVSTRTEVDFSRHILGFGFGALYGLRNTKYVFAGALVLVGTGVFVDLQYFYAGFGLLMLALAICGWVWEPAAFRRVATYSYHYFLIHGICLVAATKIFTNPFVAILLAIVAATIGAVALHATEQTIVPWMQKRFLGQG